jgi:hypothetical protein
MSDDIKTRFEDLIRFIDDRIFEAQANKPVDLGTLDQTVSKLCKEIERLKPEKARELQPFVAQMITKLDELGASIAEFKDHLKDK